MQVPKSQARPPGRRLIKRLPLRSKWILLTALGLFLNCYGLAMLAGAVNIYNQSGSTTKWVLLGLYSFGILSLGLFSLGQAIRFRILMDTKKVILKEIRIHAKRQERKFLSKKRKAKNPKNEKSPDNSN